MSGCGNARSFKLRTNGGALTAGAMAPRRGVLAPFAPFTAVGAVGAVGVGGALLLRLEAVDADLGVEEALGADAIFPGMNFRTPGWMA